MKLKKLLSLMLCIAMVLSTMGLNVFAEGETVHTVSNDTELADAIQNAVDGDTIKLAAGNYTGGISIGKNITFEGSVDENGNPTTVFSGGNVAIGISKGTVKNVKITDAFRGFYGEPCGDCVFDNVYMTGVTYGFHLVAYSNDPQWTITNCYVDASWANSFGAHQCDGATIVVRNNEFVSTTPYYDNGSGAPLVNTYSPKTIIEDNIFGANAKISIREEAKDGVKIGTNYYEDGFENALYEDCADGVKIETYYADREMTEVVEAPKGTITFGYTNNSRIWGEGGANANESFVVELYSGDEKIAQASLNDYENFIDGDVYVTWGIPFNGEDSKYWTVDWYGGNPCVDTVPTKVVLVADGVKVAENEVQMNAPDNLYPVKWEEIEAVRGSLPNAIVENLGAITVDEYNVWNGSLTQGSEPITIPVAMEFVAKDTVEEAEKNAYKDYITDFFIKIEGLSGETLDTTGCYLAGNYGDFGWIQIPLDGFTIENNTIYPILSGVTPFEFAYVDICKDVKKFYCGMYLTDEVLEANPNIKVTLSLGLSKTLEKAQAGDFITVDKAYTYGYADFKNEKPEIASYLATDAGYYDVNGEKSGLIRFLFGFDTEETNIETGVRFIKDGDITAQVGETMQGKSKAFHADITGIPENSENTYYAIAFLKVNPDTENEKIYWSDISKCTPNFEKFFGTKEQ